ncbi:MAG: hypothetical protein PHI66_00350 [Candidatus Pacebacteria bacterium]|nr:hypothetical protein [Candidatus Paceibacterota bacterium]
MKTKILPEDIDTKGNFLNTFGKLEYELMVRLIVEKCQRFNRWDHFSLRGILDLVEADCPEHIIWRTLCPKAILNQLVENGWIIDEKNGYYNITDDLIKRCHERHPTNKKAPPNTLEQSRTGWRKVKKDEEYFVPPPSE